MHLHTKTKSSSQTLKAWIELSLPPFIFTKSTWICSSLCTTWNSRQVAFHQTNTQRDCRQKKTLLTECERNENDRMEKSCTIPIFAGGFIIYLAEPRRWFCPIFCWTWVGENDDITSLLMFSFRLTLLSHDFLSFLTPNFHFEVMLSPMTKETCKTHKHEKIYGL